MDKRTQNWLFVCYEFSFHCCFVISIMTCCRIIKLSFSKVPSERSLHLLCRTLVWLHWSLCSRWDLRRGSAPDPLCPAQPDNVNTQNLYSEDQENKNYFERSLTHMARFTLFPVMFSFFVRKDACVGRGQHDYFNNVTKSI